MKTLRVNGYDMAYIDVGQGQPGAPPLVCVHGSLCDYRIWSAVIGPLSAKHRVIAVSLRHFFPDHWNGAGDTYSITQHAGAAPDLGRNALIELAHQLLQTRDVAKSIPGTQLNWTVAQAGTVRNQIPEKAVATADIRVTVPDGLKKLQAGLDEKAKEKLIPDTETTVTIEVGRPPFVATDRGRLLAKEGQQIYAEIGRTLDIVEMTGGATDAGFANRSGKAVVVESFGLAGYGYHARDEYIDAGSIVPRLYLMTRMLKELGKRK